MAPRRLTFFVYGTLQPRAGTRMGDWIAARQVRGEEASAPGRLHGVRGGNGWFPALVPGCGRVRGALCALRLTPGELARLDRYEGREYRRLSLPVRTASGRRVSAQVYVWRIALPRPAPVISRGDFLEWLRVSRRKAFSTPRNGA